MTTDTYQLTGQGHVIFNGSTIVPTSGPAEVLQQSQAWQAYQAWLADGNTPLPAPVVPPTVADFEAALTAHLDATAQARRYDNRISCALRAGYPGPFQAEGQAFAAWMDACNAQAYALLAEVQAGTRPLPTTTQALIEVLPPMEWPAP